MRAPYLFILIIAFSIKVFGQTPTPFQSIQSPNASAFKAGIESPVTLDVGKIGVNVPLYNVQDRDLSLSLTIKYNSSGVKPDVHPGWVGQGWNLSAGMITRNVKGLPDELYLRNDYFHDISGANTGTIYQTPGYVWNLTLNQALDWNSTTRIENQAKDPEWKEAEPDEYFYSCGGYSGSFFLSHDGTIVPQGSPDVKIEGEIVYNIPYFFDSGIPLNPSNPNSFTYRTYNSIFYSYYRSSISRIKGYKITTPDGVVYEFGLYNQPFDPYGTYDEVEFTVDLFDQFYSNEIFTTWYLRKVTSPSTGATITLGYERGNPVIQSSRSFSFYKAGGSAPRKGFWDWIFGPVSSYTEQAREERSGRLIRPTYLKFIETSDTRIDFSTSPSNELTYDYSPIVEEIALRSQYYSPYIYSAGLYSRSPIGVCYYNSLNPNNGYPSVVQFGSDAFRIFRPDNLTEDLDFSSLKWEKLDFIGIKAKGASTYTKTFNFSYTNNSNTRLKLLSLTDSSIPNPYFFAYNTSSTLPGYNSMRIDHWGYFNDTFVTVDPNNVTSLTNYKTLREPVDAKLYPEILTRVTYPTKGYKEFTWEPNKYKAIVSRNTTTGAFYISTLGTAKSGGGLRIAQVKEVAGNGQPDMITSYEYGDGLLNGDIQYYWPGYTGKLFNGNTYTSDRFITESLIPTIENTAGGIVSYAKVTEKMTGLGRREYDFLNFATNPDVNGNSIDPQKSPYSPFSSKSFERGSVSEVRTYDNTTTLPLVKETYLYQANPGQINLEARAVQSKGLKLFDGATEVNAVEGTSYTNYLYPYQKRSKQTQVLDKSTNTYASSLEEYTYDNDIINNDNQLKELKVTNVDGSVSTTKVKHTWDYSTGSLGAAYPEAEGLSLLYTNHIINKPILTETRFKKAGAALDSVTAVSFNTFRKFLNNPIDIPVLHKTYKLEVPSPVPSYSLILNSSTFSLDSRLKLQSYFSGYGTAASLTEVQTNYATDACIWSQNEKFLVAVVKNSTVSDIAFTSFEDFDGSWNATGTPILDPTAITGKYVYNLSSGTIWKSINSSKKYILTFWVKGSTIPSIAATLVPGESGVIRTYNGWTQYRCMITSSGMLNLSGTNLIVDELRLYPIEASMTSYTYDPQVGMTTMTDERDEITYYDYDSALRLRAIRDLQGNIIKKFDYNYQP